MAHSKPFNKVYVCFVKMDLTYFKVLPFYVEKQHGEYSHQIRFEKLHSALDFNIAVGLPHKSGKYSKTVFKPGLVAKCWVDEKIASFLKTTMRGEGDVHLESKCRSPAAAATSAAAAAAAAATAAVAAGR